MHNWHPMALQPRDRLVYIPVTVSNAPYAAQDDFVFNAKGWNTGIDFAGGASASTPSLAHRRAATSTSYILAWDPAKAKEVWRIPNEEYGASGLLATSGNLIFSGNHEGEFVAYDARTGKKLWAAPTQARVVAAPSTYLVDGQQQVAILVGARGLPRRPEAHRRRQRQQLAHHGVQAGGSATLPAEMAAPVAGATPSGDDQSAASDGEQRDRGCGRTSLRRQLRGLPRRRPPSRRQARSRRPALLRAPAVPQSVERRRFAKANARPRGMPGFASDAGRRDRPTHSSPTSSSAPTTRKRRRKPLRRGRTET